MIQVAIAGHGEEAARWREACRRVDGIEVAPEAERANVDAVILGTRPGAGLDLALAAARAGTPVVTGYHPAGSAEEAAQLEAACRERGASLTLLLPERRQPLARDVKRALDDGKLGSLRYAHSASIGGLPDETQSGSGAFLTERATPALDLLAWFFGDRVVTRVFARDCSLGTPGESSHYASIVLIFADASQAVCEIGQTAAFAPDTGLRRLALTGMRGSLYHTERDHDLVITADGARPLFDDPVAGYAEALAAWTGGSGLDAAGNLESGKTALRLARAAAESLRTGQPVALEQ